MLPDGPRRAVGHLPQLNPHGSGPVGERTVAQLRAAFLPQHQTVRSDLPDAVGETAGRDLHAIGEVPHAPGALAGPWRAWAWDDQPADFSARTVPAPIGMGGEYGVVVTIRWHRDGAVEGAPGVSSTGCARR